jgi:hypothetical protein
MKAIKIGTFTAVLLAATMFGTTAHAQCVKFDGLAAGTVWGNSAGHVSGDLVHVENGIRVSVHFFEFPVGGTFNDATVDTAWFTSSPNSVNTNNVNLGFDFTGLPGLPTQVAVKFRDLGGFENLSLNGSPITVGELAAGAGGGLTWTVTDFPVAGGREGKLVVDGAVHSLVLGGQEFWLDTLCVTATGLDHFHVYDVDDVQLEATVELRGQFDRDKSKKALVGPLTHFANPVAKNGEPIVHDNAHLTFYRLKQEEREPGRAVLVVNQFGRQGLEVGQPVLLAVPAEKREEGSSFPRHLDHFKCYEAAGEPIARRVVLEDQFGPTRSAVGEPRLFCLPVEKRHDGRVEPIRNPDAHLVLYELRPTEASRAIKTEDQFGRQGLKVLRSELLAVPTRKLFTEGG